MVDYVSTKFILPDCRIPPEMWNGEKKAFELAGMEFVPNPKNHGYTATTESLKEKGIGNLHAVLRGGQAASLHVSNSLHKAAHNGHNHTDFRFSELPGTIDKISHAFGEDFRKFTLNGRVEFGLNFQSTEPGRYSSLDQLYRGSRPLEMRKNKKRYGSVFELSSYGLKMYSPSMRNKIQGKPTPIISPNLTRFELATTSGYLRRRGVGLHHVSDLLKMERMEQIGFILVDMAKQVKHLLQPLDTWEMKDLGTWYLFKIAPAEILKRCREAQESTFKRRKRRFNELEREAQEKHSENCDELPEKVAEKWGELLHS